MRREMKFTKGGQVLTNVSSYVKDLKEPEEHSKAGGQQHLWCLQGGRTKRVSLGGDGSVFKS